MYTCGIPDPDPPPSWPRRPIRSARAREAAAVTQTLTQVPSIRITPMRVIPTVDYLPGIRSLQAELRTRDVELVRRAQAAVRELDARLEKEARQLQRTLRAVVTSYGDEIAQAARRAAAVRYVL